ncbi:hypothetical protein WJ41_13805 [Burkholderia ubonensis]|uniref:3-oxoacyl-ACP synthase III family protein n=1 Tax=Burkholderia ubonensis TaxID=101571 RepID=UPI0007593185|nr:3-oxoacyl-[acyl-carrier-protein] synthase III C-terminal domain-containing protein [Burkholderia ubonensis]KVH72202.1 hypothetical protein WJ41_13805 [Burkholderia ubonensis]KVU04720.1 hypothetical protein WK61_02365 [Burkholderia ubonensis]
MLSIEQVGCYVPERRIALEQLGERNVMSPRELQVYKRIFGLDRIALSELSWLDMLTRAAEQALNSAQLDRDQVALVVFTHTASETAPYGHGLPGRLLRRLRLQECTVFGLHSNNCASMLNALKISGHYLRGAPADRKALLVTGDLTFTGIMHSIPNTTICGDGSAACLVGTGTRGMRVEAVRIDTFGRHAGGVWQTQEQMLEFENTYATRLADVIRAALADAGCTMNEIRCVIPHNVNQVSWKAVAALLDIPMQRIYLDQLPHLGHCYGADILINLSLACEEQVVRPGDRVVLATVGLGATFAAAVVQL